MKQSTLVMTVTGPMHSGDLGHIQPHEHLIVHPTPASARNPDLCFCDYSKSLSELMTYRAAGGSTLVDAQPVFAGRDANALYSLSMESGAAIIASTGYHLDMFYSQPSSMGDSSDLYDLFCGELKTGMLAADGSQTTVKAGIVKAAIGDDGPVGSYGTKLCLAARAARDCGAALMLHTQSGKHAQDAINLCMKEHLPPSRLLICHTDRDPNNLSLQKELLKQGVWLECDTIGRFKYRSDASELKMLLSLIDAGFSSQLLLSLDTTARRLRAYGGNIGLDYLLLNFRRTMASAGVAPALWHELTCVNPANALTIHN